MAGSEGLIYWSALVVLAIYALFLTFSLSDISGKLDLVESSISENAQRLGDLEQRYKLLNEDVSSLESSLSSLDYRNSRNMRTLERNISDLNESVATLKDMVSDLEGSFETFKKGSEEMGLSSKSLERRVGNLEEALSNMREMIKDLRKSSEDDKEKILSVNDSIGNLNRKLEKLESASAEVESLKNELEKLKREVTSVLRMSSIAEEDPILAPVVDVELRKGDTVTEIAQAYEISVDEILKLNKIYNPRKLMVGQKLRLPVSLKDRITLPVEQLRKGSVIKGIDESGWIRFRVSGGVRAAMPGRVVETKEGYVRIDHGNWVETSYKFSGKVYVKEGDWVKSGQIIGSSESYLDFALLIESEPRDPFKYIFSRLGEFSATFYTEWEDGILPEQASFRITKMGNIAKRWWTVAMDPSVVALGSYVYIPQLSRMPGGGIFHVEDIGSAIKGNRVDIYVGDMTLALDLWKRDVTLYVLRSGEGKQTP